LLKKASKEVDGLFEDDDSCSHEKIDYFFAEIEKFQDNKKIGEPNNLDDIYSINQ